MTAIAITVFALACADLARAGDRARGWVWSIVAAAAAAVVGLVLLGAFALEEILLVLFGVGVVVGWVLATAREMRSRFDYALPLLILGAGLLVQAIALGWVPSRESGGLLGVWVEQVPLAGGAVAPATVLLVGAAMLAQLSTANIVVRLVLASVGALKPAGQPQASDQLRGGRLLGPMERLLILGLGLAGQPTAAGLVIAAKGLIRFPELQAQARWGLARAGAGDEPGIDEITEYFLIGSFVSWLFALASLAFIVVFA
ncbi:MAG: hypothetical protein WCA30_03970 [Dermatophilaceae bacterium]